MSLWIEASRDVEEERRIEAIAAANKALVDVHGIVMQASTAQEFEDRMAVVAERVEGVVASVTASSPMLFPIVHSAILDGLSIDFDRVQEVRRAEQQRSAAKRALFRRQRREAMEVTNTEWGIAYHQRSQPYSPEVTLSVSRTDDSVPNQWGGMGIMIKHPEYDGLQFPNMESARAFTREKGLVREARTAALTCPKCKTPVNEGARIFDHGDHEVLKAKCPSCGWSGSKRKPKSKSATMHTAMTQSEADAVLAAVKNPEHRKALEKFTPYLVYGPGYSRGITENFMDAVRFSNRDEGRYFNISFSKLEAHLDIINGGDADQWAFDREMGIYTKKLFSSKTAADRSPNDIRSMTQGEEVGTWNIFRGYGDDGSATSQLGVAYDQLPEDAKQWLKSKSSAKLAWSQLGDLWTAKTGSLTAEAVQTGAALALWGVYDDVSGQVIAEGHTASLETAKQAAEWNIVTKEKGRQLDGPFGSMDEAQKRWEREYEPDSTEVRESSRRNAAVKLCDQCHEVPAEGYAMGPGSGDWGGHYCQRCADRLGWPLQDRSAYPKTAAGYTQTPKSVKLKDGTIIPDVMGTDPDPGHPDGKIWVGFDSNGARRRWHDEDIASTNDIEFTLNTSWVDERMDQQRESARRIAEFPPKKDEKKDDSANDTTDSDKDGEQDGPVQPGEKPEGDQQTDPAASGAQDQATPTTPTTEGQPTDDQASDPTMMDVGQSSSMSYTMSDGGAGSIEVTFVREENGVYFFNGPTGEFGVGQQNGQWQDSAGNTFGFGGQQAPAPAQQAAPAAPQGQQAPQQPPAAPQAAAPAQDAPPADKGDAKKDDSGSKDDEEKKDAPPWAKKSSFQRTAVQEHTFPDTGTAYDSTQWREDIHDGDVLIIPSEKVVGFLLSAWPIAVTEEPGFLHQLNTPGELPDDSYTSVRQEGFDRAVEIAKQKGWKLHA